MPVPANVEPAQQKRYAPLKEFPNRTALALLSSCTQTSNTDTVNEQLAELPAASPAVQVTVVTPVGKQLPDGGTQLTIGIGQLSATVGAL